MASNTRSSGTAALRYASALADLAVENGSVAQVEQDMADLRAMIDSSPELRTLIRSPLMGAKAQIDGLSAIADAAKFSPLSKNFLLTLAQNGRLADIDAVLKALDASFSARRGELEAKIDVAQDLSAEQAKALQDTLAKAIGSPVRLKVSVKGDLIGGMVVTLGSFMIDDSVKSKLERLSRAMKYGRDAA